MLPFKGMPSGGLWQGVLMSLAAAFGCGRYGFDPVADTPRDASSQDSGPQASADGGQTACTSFGPFRDPVAVDGVNSDANDWAPSISSDQLTLYLSRNYQRLLMATRAQPGAPFDSPERLAEMDNQGATSEPDISADGLTLYFQSERGSAEAIWRATRTGAAEAFDAIEPIGDESWEVTFGPSVTADELELYFHTGPFGNATIMVSRRTSVDEDFGDPEPVVGVQMENLWGYPGISSDRRELYFVRTPSRGEYEIWVARRSDRSSDFGTPELVDEINETGPVSDPELSYDGTTLYFSTDQGSGDEDWDIWMATRTCLDP